MTILLNIKTSSFHSNRNFLHNHSMTKQQHKRSSSVLLILGIPFLAIGLATDQTTFTWIAIAFVLVSLIMDG
jgi:hypothetical protein